jgi:hypothetical protein
MTLLNWKLGLLRGHFGLLVPVNQKCKGGATDWLGWLTLTTRGEVECCYRVRSMV